MTWILWAVGVLLWTWVCLECGGRYGRRVGRAEGYKRGSEDTVRRIAAW